jgi:integrase
MALYLYQNPTSGIFYIRGAHHGVTVDESARTRIRADAEGVRERREREIYAEVILGKKPDRSFAEAALGYMNGEGEAKYLTKILAAQLKVDGRRVVFGEMLLKDIDQSVIDDLAALLYPNAKSSTRNRQVYTPVSAVLTWASDQKSWQFSHGRVRRPRQPKGKLDWRTPKEIEWWLARVGDLRPLITAYVGTGARASEMLNLQWPNVTPALHRITLWEDETKADTARGIDLQLRVRGVMPTRPANNKGHVWLKADGTRWSTYDAINNRLWHVTARDARAVASKTEQDEITENLQIARTQRVVGLEARKKAATRARELITEVAQREDIPRIHCHVFRHTWATWAYAVTRDMPWVMAQGGWATAALAMRYIHVGSADLAEDVLDHGWEIRPGIKPRLLALPSPESA